jgi:hypothetical protein
MPRGLQASYNLIPSVARWGGPLCSCFVDGQSSREMKELPETHTTSGGGSGTWTSPTDSKSSSTKLYTELHCILMHQQHYRKAMPCTTQSYKLECYGKQREEQLIYQRLTGMEGLCVSGAEYLHSRDRCLESWGGWPSEGELQRVHIVLASSIFRGREKKKNLKLDRKSGARQRGRGLEYQAEGRRREPWGHTCPNVLT